MEVDYVGVKISWAPAYDIMAIHSSYLSKVGIKPEAAWTLARRAWKTNCKNYLAIFLPSRWCVLATRPVALVDTYRYRYTSKAFNQYVAILCVVVVIVVVVVVVVLASSVLVSVPVTGWSLHNEKVADSAMAVTTSSLSATPMTFDHLIMTSLRVVSFVGK